MSHTKLKILLVDDDPVLIEMHSALLEKNDYSVLVAEDGEQALKMLDKFNKNIGVVVSDITMPNMDGYELCTQIKKNDNTCNIPVIFVSAHTGLEEKLKGFAVGADDYIPKPVNEEELRKKIGILLEMHEKHDVLSKQVVETQSAAMQAMTLSGELVQVIDFYKKVLNATDYKEVADCYFDVVSVFRLVSILQIYTPHQVLNLSAGGFVSPLEANVIELARDKGRFFDFGARTIVNYDAFSLLIKNMPLNDREKYDRIKDILSMLGSGLESKIQQLNTEGIDHQKDSVFLSIKRSMRHIEALFADTQKENIAAIEDMSNKIDELIQRRELDEPLENDIRQVTDACLERLNKSSYNSAGIKESLKDIYQQFEYVLGAEERP